MTSTGVLTAGAPWKPAENATPTAAIAHSSACSAIAHCGLAPWKRNVRNGE